MVFAIVLQSKGLSVAPVVLRYNSPARPVKFQNNFMGRKKYEILYRFLDHCGLSVTFVSKHSHISKV